MEDQPLAGTVWLIPISHLDTQWRGTVRDTAARLLPATVAADAHPKRSPLVWITATIPGCRSRSPVATRMSSLTTCQPA
jgi:hypothetical protein